MANIFKKVWRGVKKVFKKIGRSIKKGFTKFGKFMNKIGIVGQIALMIALPHLGAYMLNTLGASSWGGLFSSMAATGSNVLIKGAGHILKAAHAFATTAGNIVGSITQGVVDFGKWGMSKIGVGNPMQFTDIFNNFGANLANAFDPFRAAYGSQTIVGNGRTLADIAKTSGRSIEELGKLNPNLTSGVDASNWGDLIASGDTMVSTGSISSLTPVEPAIGSINITGDLDPYDINPEPIDWEVVDTKYADIPKVTAYADVPTGIVDEIGPPILPDPQLAVSEAVTATGEAGRQALEDRSGAWASYAGEVGEAVKDSIDPRKVGPLTAYGNLIDHGQTFGLIDQEEVDLDLGGGGGGYAAIQDIYGEGQLQAPTISGVTNIASAQNFMNSYTQSNDLVGLWGASSWANYLQRNLGSFARTG